MIHKGGDRVPVGSLKNTLYGLALPLLGKRCEWKAEADNSLHALLHSHHVVGACIQRFEKGRLADCHAVGCAALGKAKRPVAPDTVFRTASVAKMATALLVFRLQTLGALSVQEDISDFLGYRVRNPHFPDAPITLGMLLSHTSSIADSEAYFASFQQPADLSELLTDASAFLPQVPGMAFRYSNLAAGMVGCLLEKRFGLSFEQLAQQKLFEPLNVQATFDASRADAERTADSYRVLPPALAFNAKARIAAAQSLDAPNPQRHYLQASGSLFLTARDLAKLTLTAWNGAEGFLNAQSIAQMQTPLLGWPQKEVNMRHGMGLFRLEEPSVCSRPLWGHQGFAYGAVNGVFFDAEGSGFVCLNSGASERRLGHLSLLNRDLIRLWFKQGSAEDA